MRTPRASRQVLLGSLSLGLALLGLLLAGLGCGDDDSPTGNTPPPVTLDRSSPQAVLASLREAYLNRRIADYDSLLAADFEFYFSEQDLQIAEKYLRSEEVDVHTNMFSSTDLLSIDLDFTLGELTQDESMPDTLGADEYLWTILMTNTDLELRRKEGGQLKTYQLDDAVQRFWFRRENRMTPGTGRAIWTIVEWRELWEHDLDKGSTWGGAWTEDSTWGQIKSLYRS